MQSGPFESLRNKFTILKRGSGSCIGLCEISNSPFQGRDIHPHHFKRSFYREIGQYCAAVAAQSVCLISSSDQFLDEFGTGTFDYNKPKYDNSSQIDTEYWPWLQMSEWGGNPFTAEIVKDIARLTDLRTKYSLVFLELGSIESNIATRLSTLCDGLMLIATNEEFGEGRGARSGKSLINRIRSLERTDCRWLGYWKVA